MSAQDVFDAVAWLDPPILVSRRVSRGPYDATIAGKRTRLWLPAKGPRELVVGTERNSVTGGIPEFPPPRLATPITKGLWTAVGMSAIIPERPLIVKAFRLRWKDPERAADERTDEWLPGGGYETDLAPWLSLVRDWLSAWLGGTWRSVASEATPTIRLARVGGKAVADGGGQEPFGVYLPARRISTPGELRAAFVMASAGRRLPLAHQMFAEALAYAEGARGRQAVISACTAAEVALSESLERLLVRAGRDEKERKEILERSPLPALYRLHAATKGVLPVPLRTVQKTLATPRNQAAHGGREPAEEAVRQALTTSKALLALSPLPTAIAINRVAK